MPELHTRLLADVIALGSPYPLVLTGGYAVLPGVRAGLAAGGPALPVMGARAVAGRMSMLPW